MRFTTQFNMQIYSSRPKDASRFAAATFLAAALSILPGFTSAGQRSGTPDLRLVSAAVGPGGTVVDGKFVLSQERNAFSRQDDKELVVTFQWEGAPGVHRMIATWRGPDGTVSSSAPIEYDAKDRRFGAYWRFSLSPTMAIGSWTVDIAVDGQPGGKLDFEVKTDPVPMVAMKRVLTQPQLFETLNVVHVVLQRSTSAGRVLDPAAAMLGANGSLHTVTSAIDETDRVSGFTGLGNTLPITTVLAWNRSARWATLASTAASPASELVPAKQEDVKIGDRCYALDGSLTGSRVLLEGAVSGRMGGERPSWIVGFQNGFARPGSPVINDSGEILGLIDSPTRTYESIKAQIDLKGQPLIPYSLFKAGAGAAAVTLDELRARNELMLPVLGDAHIVSGGFAADINRGSIVAPSDQRTEFSTAEKAFTVFVTWSPQERLKGMMSIKLFTANNQLVSQSKPKKSDLRKQDLVLSSWQIPMIQSAGIYRADILLDNKVMWRGYVRLTP
jgi:hypothetical protein